MTGFQEAVAKVLEYADYVVGNESEALAWAETQGHQSKSVNDIAKLLVQLPVRKSEGKENSHHNARERSNYQRNQGQV